MTTTSIPKEQNERLLHRPPTTPVLVDVPPYDNLAVDGVGDPNGPSFQQAVPALYSIIYPVVITLRRMGRTDVKVWPLEAMWWADDYAVFKPETIDREAWRWTALLRLPEDVPDDVMAMARSKAEAKLGAQAAQGARIDALDEGRCAQVMHRGPFADEGPTIAALHAFIAEQGLFLNGPHHEIYLSDPRRCAPAKMRTVLRQPVSSTRFPPAS